MEMTHQSIGDRPEDILDFEMSKDRGCISMQVANLQDGTPVVILGVGLEESCLLPDEADQLAAELFKCAAMAREPKGVAK